MMKPCTSFPSIVLALAFLGGTARAQVAESSAPAALETADGTSGLGDIVVTAQKREQKLQDVPIAIAVVGGKSLEAAGAQSTLQLQTVAPSLNISSSAGGGVVRPSIRAVGASTNGPGIENSVATYIDGVYLASAVASFLTLTSIDRVEVLKGPQGTLFGRNATGGLINIITRDPTDDLSGSADLSYGNYQTLTARSYIAGPIVDGVKADLALQYTRQGDGYGTNLTTGNDNARTHHDFSARSKWLLYPTDSTKVTLTGDYAQYKKAIDYSPYPTNLVPFAFFTSPYTGGPYNTQSDFEHRLKFSGGGASARIEQAIGDLSLISITAYRKSQFETGFDFDFTPDPFINIKIYRIAEKQFSQEVQLLSSSNKSFSWILGGYYFYYKSQLNHQTVEFLGPLASQGYLENRTGQQARSYSGFAQADLSLTSTTEITVGGRYTKEDRSLIGSFATFDPAGNPTFQAVLDNAAGTSKSFSKATFRAAINHHFSPDMMGYLSFNRGFRSGGFNPGDPFGQPYNPEVLDAYEAGIKSDPIKGVLRLNLSTFYYKYKNLQINRYVNGGVIILNGPAAEIYGGELEVNTRLSDRLKLDTSLAVMHDRFTTYPDADYYVGCPTGASVPCAMSAKGKKLPYAPSVTGNASLTYTLPLSGGSQILANANIYYNSGYSVDAAKTLSQGAYSFVNASLKWESVGDRYSINIWGRNLNGALVASELSITNTGAIAQYYPPRTYGMTVGVKF
jgi:iron complex outermembrane recepter protein